MVNERPMEVAADTSTLTISDTADEIARHGFEHDEQFLTMLQQVYFMYYNVGWTVRNKGDTEQDRTRDTSLVAIRDKTQKSCLIGECESE